MPLPLFISFEGGEGSGKTSLAERISVRLESAGLSVLFIHEPGTTPLGIHLRDILKGGSSLKGRSGDGQAISPGAELFLFSAARAELVTKVIKPVLDDNRQIVILADRYVDSTLAYQGYGRKMPLRQIQAINMLATHGIVPHRTFLLDMAPQIGLDRTRSPQLMMPFDFDFGLEENTRRVDEEGTRRFEDESLEFHERVRKGYRRLAKREPKRWRVIDASKSKTDIEREVWQCIMKDHLTDFDQTPDNLALTFTT